MKKYDPLFWAIGIKFLLRPDKCIFIKFTLTKRIKTSIVVIEFYILKCSEREEYICNLFRENHQGILAER